MFLKGGLHTKTTYFLLLLGWMLGLGLLILLRFIGTGLSPFWMDTPVETLLVWLVVSFLVATFHFLTILVTDSRRFRRRSYGFFIFVQVLTVVTLLILAMISVRLVGALFGSFPANEMLPSILEQLSDVSAIGSILFFFLWTAVLTFIRQMMVKVGPRMLWNLFVGKYHNPRVEQRIFLFVDLQSSTTIAGKLGHQTYSRFIQDCFYDLTDSVIKYDVEIYQYIGDEAVLTWRTEDGIRDANCVKVYFDFIRTLRSRAPYYLEQYGVAPFFKAGLNVGDVTVTEIGVIKREIAYLSEVLHTAARIQGKCNEFGQGLLLSGTMKALLADNPELEFTSLGELELRGKLETEELFAVGINGAYITY